MHLGRIVTKIMIFRNTSCHFLLPLITFIYLLKNINNSNKTTKTEMISFFDFSIMFANTSQTKLLKVMNELIDFCFDGSINEYIAVTKFEAKLRALLFYLIKRVLCYYGYRWMREHMIKDLIKANKFYSIV